MTTPTCLYNSVWTHPPVCTLDSTHLFVQLCPDGTHLLVQPCLDGTHLFVQLWLDAAQLRLLLVLDALHGELDVGHVQAVRQHPLEAQVPLGHRGQSPLPTAADLEHPLGSRSPAGRTLRVQRSVAGDVRRALADAETRLRHPVARAALVFRVGARVAGHLAVPAEVPGGEEKDGDDDGTAAGDGEGLDGVRT